MWEEELHGIATALGGRVVSADVLAGGFSHRTLLVDLGDRRVVARFGGGDPEVEAGVMAVARRAVPVPEVLSTRPRAMVVEFVPGTLLSSVLDDDRIGPADAGALGHEVGRVVAGIGAITFDRPGFFAGGSLDVTAEAPWSEQLGPVAAECMGKVPAGRLDDRTRDDWARLCAEQAPVLRAVDSHARLVHADINPKNILVSRHGSGWRVDSVLDWEFSYSGCTYGDAANMARFEADHPAGFLNGFRAGFREGQPADLTPPDDWFRIGRVLDMFALSDLVTRPAGHTTADQAADQIRAWVRGGVPS